jgi:phosphopantetheinyl transferase
MEEFLRTQGALVDAVLAHGRKAPGRTLSLESDPVLRDHTIGGRVSEEDPSLTALPVVPFAFSLDMMAGAAAAQAPGRVPAGFRDVRVHRFIALSTGKVQVTFDIRPAGEKAFDVAIRIDGETSPVVEARVLLAERHPGPPAPAPFVPTDAKPCRWSGPALYDERETHGMFHGPALRGVASVDAVGADGALATLRIPPAVTAPLATDPVLLDVTSQVLGYWTASLLPSAFVVFPFAVEAIDLFSPALPPGSAAKAAVRAHAAGGGLVRADFETSASGSVRMRARGWQVKRIDLPADLYAFRQSPRDVILSAPTPAPGKLGGSVSCCRLSLPIDFMDADGGVWWETLAHFALGRSERDVWRSLTGARRRRDWLMGRVAAKDAVRLHLLATRGVRLFPADIAIVADRFGKPEPSGPALARLGVSLSVSIAHTDGAAMALASEPARGIGIDIESLERKRGDYERAAFHETERALLGDTDAARRERALRLWCAKEAVAKALGRGLMGSPLNLERKGGDDRLERVDLAVKGSLARELPHLVDRPVTAFVTRQADWIVATALGDPS